MLNPRSRMLGYLWAAPATAVGLAVAGVACLLGASTRSVDGVLEVADGRLLGSTGAVPGARRYVAITLGHVILGRDPDVLDRHRAHEHEHVRQYERWGVFFFPLYFGSSLVQLIRGRRPYYDNHFERQARAEAERRRRA